MTTAAFLFPTIFFFLYTLHYIALSNAIDFGLSCHLIHRDSPLSPFYNRSMTTSDRIQAAAHRSISRLNHIRSLSTTTFSSSDLDLSSPIDHSSGEYFVHFYVGTPPTKVRVAIDTATDLISLKCSPSPTDFNPSNSSSYSNHLCNSKACETLKSTGRSQCDGLFEPCSYTISNAVGSTTTGLLAHDKLAFDDDSQSNYIDVGSFNFGCNDNFPNFGGVLGLNRQPLSLISQLDIKKFSYCLVLLEENEASVSSKIHFGSNAMISGGQTPLMTPEGGSDDGQYYLILEGISLGDQNQNVPLTSGLYTIDSGTAYTTLESQAYDALVKVLIEATNLPRTKNPPKPFELCFEGSYENLDDASPVVTFKFRGTQVIMSTNTTYVPQPERQIWCLAMLRGSRNMFGSFQQMDFMVGYDLVQGVVSFSPVDCSVF